MKKYFLILLSVYTNLSCMEKKRSSSKKDHLVESARLQKMLNTYEQLGNFNHDQQSSRSNVLVPTTSKKINITETKK